jgi:cyclophilin family peptidyl-prolyl cis-trans isomerase
LARAAAIDDLPTAPTETQSLVASILRDREVDAAQALVSAVERWQLPKPKAAALLSPLLQGAVWAVWLQAWQALHKLEPATPWPGAPDLTARDREILALAEQLLTRTKPVRLKLNFASPAPGSPSGKVIRQVVLQLDAQRAPINVANLLLLARKGFYTGRAISRVVPEFVLQLGSPLETMDGGPGYHVPCENHLAPYTAGSVGMALSGKDTGGSQFFVTLAAAPHLTGSYTRVGFLEDLPRSLKVVRDLGPGDVLVQVSEL